MNILNNLLNILKSFTLSDLFFFTSSLILILVLTYLVYLVRIETYEDPKSKRRKNSFSLNKEIIKDIPLPMDIKKYEEEQENTAIISYDELLARTSNNISYDDNYKSGFDDLDVKKVTKFSETTELVNLPKVLVMNYEEEEEFLNAINELNDKLRKE